MTAAPTRPTALDAPWSRLDPDTQWYASDPDWAEALMRHSPALGAPYRAPLWGRNPHLQTFGMLAVEAHLGVAATPSSRQPVPTPDGGTIDLAWFDAPASTRRSTTTPTPGPVIIVLPTICGDHRSISPLVAELRALLGWTVVVCNRRGHGDLPLTAPKVNTMGDPDDLRLQLDAIQARHPGAPLYAIGVSAGSGLLVRHLGTTGAASRLRASVICSPAYDIERGFDHVHPAYDRYMTRKLVRFFITRHASVWPQTAALDHLASATTLAQFHRRLYAISGHDSPEAFFAASNPIVFTPKIRTPTLTLNAQDDPVCVYRNVLEHAHHLHTLPHAMLAVTRFGAHCAWLRGRWPWTSWHARATAAFFTAQHALDDDA